MKHHYSDPTANTAIAHVDRELRMKKKLEERAEKAGKTRKASGPKKQQPAEPPAQREKDEQYQRFCEWLRVYWPVPGTKE